MSLPNTWQTQTLLGVKKAKPIIAVLVEAGKAEFDAIEFVYDHLDEMIDEGDLTTIDEILRSTPVAQVPLSVSLSILTITGGERVKHQLTWRHDFYNRVEQHLRELGYQDDSIEKNLYGLK